MNRYRLLLQTAPDMIERPHHPILTKSSEVALDPRCAARRLDIFDGNDHRWILVR